MVEEKREVDKDNKEDQEDILNPATKVNNAPGWHL
jgi:hypothetical protein